MLQLILFGFLTGLDNFQVSAAIGASGVPRRRQWSIAAIFAAFETTMPFLGLLVGSRLQGPFKEIAPWLGPVFMLLIGLFLLVRSRKGPGQLELLQRNAILFPLAFFMSLDNLMAGVGFGSLGYSATSAAPVMGLCAGAMCFLGLFAGEWARRIVPRQVELLTALYLVGLAVFKIALDRP